VGRSWLWFWVLGFYFLGKPLLFFYLMCLSQGKKKVRGWVLAGLVLALASCLLFHICVLFVKKKLWLFFRSLHPLLIEGFVRDMLWSCFFCSFFFWLVRVYYLNWLVNETRKGWVEVSLGWDFRITLWVRRPLSVVVWCACLIKKVIVWILAGGGFQPWKAISIPCMCVV
jgi:hypothetical protein